nr:hypothetical protein [Tanacetum cinerariifolium]
MMILRVFDLAEPTRADRFWFGPKPRRGKSCSALQRLFAGAVLNAKVGVTVAPTLPFVTAFVSTTPEREDEDHTEVVAESNLRTIGAPQSVTNGSRLDDGRVCHEMVNDFAHPKFFASVRGMEHDQLFTKFNVGAARQMSLSVEVRMQAEYNVKERRRLKSVVEKKDKLQKARYEEIENLKAQMLLKEAEAAKAFISVLKLPILRLWKSPFGMRLQEKLSSYESLAERLREFQDPQLKIVNDKFDKLYANFVKMALHLEEKFYPHLLTTIFGRRWLLTHGMELALVNCLHSPECLSALGAAIGKAIKKGMQDGLSAGIIHGKEGRVLTDSNKDASIETVMDILHLENPLAKKTIVENIANHRLALRDVFIPLADPFSAVVLTGSEGTSNVMPTIVDTTTVMSATLASVSTIDPIFVDDYEVLGMDDQAGANGNAEPFMNMSADVARGHEGDGSDDDRPLHMSQPKVAEVVESQQDAYPKENQNLGLRKITDELCPQPIRFEWKDNGTMLPLGDHSAHWANLLEEIVRVFPMHFCSCASSHRSGRQGSSKRLGINISGFGLIPRTWPGVLKMLKTEQRTRSYAGRDPKHLLPIRDMQMHNSATQEYPSLTQTFFDIHTVGDVFLRDENRRLYGLGTYIDDQIMAMVRRGKQRGHIPGVDSVFAGRGKDVLDVPVPRCNHTSDVDELKNKQLQKQIDMITKAKNSGDRIYGVMSPGKSVHRGTRMVDRKPYGPDVVARENCRGLNPRPAYPNIFSLTTCRRGKVSPGICRRRKLFFVPGDSGKCCSVSIYTFEIVKYNYVNSLTI